MKKGIIVLLLIAVLCVGHVFADDNGPWSVGAQLGFVSGIAVTGGYDTLTVNIGIVPWTSSLNLGYGINWFYPFSVTEAIRLGPGIGINGYYDFGQEFFMIITPLFGFEYQFSEKFCLSTKLGYPGFIIENHNDELLVTYDFNFDVVPIAATLGVGVKYYF